MKYDLVKQLKDAGFEILFDSKGELTCKSQALAREQGIFVSCDHQKCILQLEEVYFPTLSELIEACGESFGSLEKLHSTKVIRWYAKIPDISGVNLPGHCEGDTPEGAVANLWLKLNKKA